MSTAAELPDDAPSIEDRAAQMARNGWGPIPLPTGKKAQPPVGFTGKSAPVPSFADWYAVFDGDRDAWGNLGARVPENVVGVDVDSYDGKGGALTWELIGGPEFPETVVLSSRFGPGYDGLSGIRFYRLPDGITQDMLWGAHDGIEILRLDHRYAVAPGSKHPLGGYYRVIDVRTGAFLNVLPVVMDLPVLTVEQALKLSKDGAPWAGEVTAGERPRDENPQCAYTARILNRAVGDLKTRDSRYDTMSRTVWSLVKGEDEGHHLGQALEILKLAYIAAVGKERREAGHEPPASEFDRNVADARRKVAAEPTDDMFKACCSTGFTDDPVAPPQEADTLDDDARDRVLAEFPALDWDALWAEDDSGEEWLAEPLLARGRGVSIYSPVKAGKSLLLLEIAVLLACGESVFGYEPKEPITVLYVDFENDPRGDVRTRLKDMGRDPSHLARVRYLSFPSLSSLDTPQGGQQLVNAAKAYGADIVIIDTASRVISGPENDNDTWLAFYKHTGMRLKVARIGYVRLDHSGKDPNKGARGGSAKGGDVDAIWHMKAEGDGVVILSLDDARFPIAERYLPLRRETAPTLRHVVDSSIVKRRRSEAVAAAMQDLVAHGVDINLGRQKACDALKAAGVTAHSQRVVQAAQEQRREQAAQAEIFGDDDE